MHFIVTVALMLSMIIALIVYKVLEENLIPIINSEHSIRFRKRVSNAIYLLLREIWKDFFVRLETICEPDGDEPYEPFMDTPLRTCPPTEFLLQEPTEEIDAENIQNEEIVPPPRRRGGRRRIMLPPNLVHPPRIAVDVVPVAAPNLPLVNMPLPRRGVARRVVAQNFRVVELQQQLEIEQANAENQRNRLGPRRVEELRVLADELVSPPPQLNDNGNEGNVFQFQ